MSFKINLSFFFTFSFGLCFSQNFTVQCNTVWDEEEEYGYNQSFNFSVNDSVLVHNIFDSDMDIEQSQLYKIVKFKTRSNEVSDIEIFNYKVQSGISGMYYYYEISINPENGRTIILMDQYPLKSSSTTLSKFSCVSQYFKPFENGKTSFDDKRLAELKEHSTNGTGGFAAYIRELYEIHGADSAVLVLEEALSSNLFETEPEKGVLVGEIGLIKFQEGDYQEALRLLDRSIKMGHTSAYNFNNRANTLHKLDDLDGACKDWNIALEKGYHWREVYKERYQIENPLELVEKYCNKN